MKKEKFEPDIEIESEDSYNSSSKGSYKELLMEIYRKCCIEGSKEMTKGGMIRRETDEGIIEVTLLDQVEIYINSVITLRNLLHPEIISNSKFKKKIEQFDKKLQTINLKKRNLLKKLNQWYLNIPNRRIERPNGLLSYSDRELAKPSYDKYRKNINNSAEKSILNLYRNNLFVTLIELLASLNYLETSGGTF